MAKIPLSIIGLGRIGAGNENLSNYKPMSHLAAAMKHGGFDLINLVDESLTRCSQVKDRYHLSQTKITTDIDKITHTKGSVIVIATPPDTHKAIVDKITKYRPSLVLIEKPLGRDLISASQIVDKLAEAKIPLRVNFNRHFDTRIQKWKSFKPTAVNVNCTYNKGLSNYASHLVDLLINWYGPVITVSALYGTPRDVTHNSNFSFYMRMQAGFFATFHGLEDINYELCEMEIQGINEQLVLRAGGAEIIAFKAHKNQHYKGYTTLREQERDIGLVSGFSELYNAIYLHISKNKKLAGCDASSALANIKILEAALTSAKNGGCEIQL